MKTNEILKQAGALIECGEIGKAKTLLLEALTTTNDSQDIETILRDANTILALEIIEQCCKKKPKDMEKFADALNHESQKSQQSTEEELKTLLGRFN
jgi:proteasome assembly chaperone (PAC2) family protein